MFIRTGKRKVIALILCILMVVSVCAVNSPLKSFAEGNVEDGFASASDAEVDEAENVQESVYKASGLNVNFAVVEQSRFDTPAKDKYIVIDLGDGSEGISNAQAVIFNRTSGTEMVVDADKIVGSSMLFYVSFPDASYKGSYVVDSVRYEAGGEYYEKSLSDDGLAPEFGVNTDANTDPSGWIYEGEDPEVVGAELQNQVVDISDDFSNANVIGVDVSTSKNKDSNTLVFSTAPENVVIVLDPGHGAGDTGACYTWNGVVYCERDINQTIANACKAELEKYSNVTVYLTRESTTEAFHGSTGDDLKWRCDYAHEMGADLFVSLHCNSSASVNSRKGAEVYVPNSSYSAQAYNVGKTVGAAIGAKLASLGISNGTTYTRNSENGTKYDDGSIADYYAVIRHCKKYGIPGMIVEHGYINNSSDCINFFGTNEKIEQLGIADAQAIAANIGLLEENRVAGDSSSTGWRKSGTNWAYYVDGTVCTGFFKVNGYYYYAKSNGFIVTDWQLINGSWYYFDKSGVMISSTWMKNKSDQWIYLLEDGKMAIGFKTIGNTSYYFNNDGAMQTGWMQIKDKWYYADSSGALYKNRWLKSGGYWYFFDGNCEMVSGWAKDGGVYYYMAAGGQMQSGWIQEGNSWYYADSSGAIYQNRWMKSSKGYWYYFDDSCRMADGWTSSGGVTYCMAASGEMQTGWINKDGAWYYADDSGAVSKNAWLKSDKGYWYYFNDKCKMVTGWAKIGNVNYYMVASGEMQTGWFKIGNNWCYATNDGEAYKSRWLEDGSKWYYFDEEGLMVTSQRVIDETVYYFNSAGEMTGSKSTKDVDLYKIMGTSDYKADQFVARFNKEGMTYPAEALGAGGAKDINTFCKIIVEEATTEGVKPEVVFSQIMVETGWLQFGGNVAVTQFNFCGLGATGGVSGESYATVRTGIRAQVQHLKGYATKDALKNNCVDNRYQYIDKGCAPYVEYLGQNENPSKKGWATAKDYGYSILNILYSIK